MFTHHASYGDELTHSHPAAVATLPPKSRPLMNESQKLNTFNKVLVINLHCSYTVIIDHSVFTYDSALSFLVICVQCYIGPCGVLVPTGTVHSNNEFEFEVIFLDLPVKHACMRARVRACVCECMCVFVCALDCWQDRVTYHSLACWTLLILPPVLATSWDHTLSEIASPLGRPSWLLLLTVLVALPAPPSLCHSHKGSSTGS